MYSRKIMRFVILALCLLGFCLLVIANITVQKRMGVRADISNVTVQSLDREIKIAWDSPAFSTLESIRLTISDGAFTKEETISPSFFGSSYSFTEGEHGTRYTVSLTARFTDGSYGTTYEKQTMFLQYDQLPDLPLLNINTFDGQDPTYTQAQRPNDVVLGNTIIDNDPMIGTLNLSNTEYANITARVKIQVRGNTSALLYDKKSYKIVLDQPFDLLEREPAQTNTEWCLLNAGININTYVGAYVSTLCGIEWQPQMRYVNLLLNGDWKGCYLLIEPISQETAGNYITPSGYIVENDPYFWNEEGNYFQTNYQDTDRFGYTLKYPKITDLTDRRVGQFQDYLQEAEHYFVAGDERYQEYIDEVSFASWILAKDVLGEFDGAGSNIFLYKYDFDENDPTSSKLKMGPLWDFDNVFLTPDSWSGSRYHVKPFFPHLFSRHSFSALYVEKWRQLSENLYSDTEKALSALYAEEGTAIEESWRLDAARWQWEVLPLSAQIDNALQWFAQRRIWMNDQLGLEG